MIKEINGEIEGNQEIVLAMEMMIRKTTAPTK